MAYSNRPSKWADPTVAPTFVDPVTGKRYVRDPFTQSPYQEAKLKRAAEARKRNRSK
jgi:hypothetical protein